MPEIDQPMDFTIRGDMKSVNGIWYIGVSESGYLTLNRIDSASSVSNMTEGERMHALASLSIAAKILGGQSA